VIALAKTGVFDIDKGWSKIIREMKQAAELTVEVGVQAGETTEDGKADLAAVASINEFGTDTIPSRPFMRESFDQNIGKIDKFMQDAGGKIVAHQISARQGLELVGYEMTGIIQKKIVDGPWVPNTPATIRQKKNEKDKNSPLIDIGRLRQSIRHEVKPK